MRLLAIAEPLAATHSRELIIARLVADEDELSSAAVAVNARRAMLAASARTAVFTTTDAAGDVARLAAAHDVDLVLCDGAADLAERVPPGSPPCSSAHRPTSPCSWERPRSSPAGALCSCRSEEASTTGPRSSSPAGSRRRPRLPLRLVGTRADPRRGRRDASRLLADASLAVQRLVGVETEPVLAEPSEDGLLKAVETAAIVVAGISEQWRREGIGASRRALVHGGRAPTLLVHRGPRPGGLAPRDGRTRFTWTLDASSR